MADKPAIVVGLETKPEAASSPDMMGDEAREGFDAFMDAFKAGDKELAFEAFKRAVMACSSEYSE